jgi:hypothetical protein
MTKNEKQYWLDDSRNGDKIFWILCGLCVLVGLSDFLYDKHVYFLHDRHARFETLTDFYAWYGFVSCVGLVLIAKQLRKILQRREDYYDE